MFRSKTIIVVVATLVFSVPDIGSAQTPPDQREKVDLEMVAKIREEGLQRSQVMETLSYLTDVHGPRLTGSPQIKKAGGWAVSKLSEWGLQESHLEPWGPFGR